jgi:hypothetical protein
MSEYQYYEFRAIDRPLNDEEMEELRKLSSRAEITPTSFTNTYQWGSFKGKPAALMERYFDAFVYVANWGTRQLMFRIPSAFVDGDAVEPYCHGDTVSLTAKDEFVVLEFASVDESGGGWTDGESWMSSLVSIRDELMRGDLRALYIGWLASFPERGWYGEDADVDVEEIEPPVPPGLASLSAPLQALADFLRVEDELLEAAAAGSKDDPTAALSRAEMAAWVETLPNADKNAYLLRLLAEEGTVLLRAELSKRFREAAAPHGKGRADDAGRRSVAHLLAAQNVLVKEKAGKTAEQAAAKKERHEQEQAEARTRELDHLASREPAAWREVEQLIGMKRPNDYDRAVALLVDLRDLAARSDRAQATAERTREIRLRHMNKPSLLERLRDKKLGG